jgi:hypothetical protein
MHTFARTALVLATAVLVAACGGGGDNDDSSSAASKERSAKDAESAGYFDEEQSDALNPLLAKHDSAGGAYYEGADACEKEAAKLFAAGRTPRDSVQCHFDLVADYRDAIVELREGIEDVEGDFREPCEDQVKEFTAFLVSYEQALDALHGDWEAYASNKPTPDIQKHGTAIDKLAKQFGEQEIPAMSKACYTEADRKAAGKA